MINLLVLVILGVLTVHAQFPSSVPGMSSPMMSSMMLPPSSAASALPSEATSVIQNVMRSPTGMSGLADMLYFRGRFSRLKTTL